MAAPARAAAADGQVPAAAIRALRDAIAGLARSFGHSGGNANSVLVALGASHADAQELYEYLAAHPAGAGAEDPR